MSTAPTAPNNLFNMKRYIKNDGMNAIKSQQLLEIEVMPPHFPASNPSTDFSINSKVETTVGTRDWSSWYSKIDPV